MLDLGDKDDRRVIVSVIIVAIAIVAVLLYVIFTREGEEPPKNVENVGGKYNAAISFLGRLRRNRIHR